VHAADAPRLLRAKKGQLCFECHGDLRKLDTLAAVHPPFGDQECGDCHLPHASANAGLLNKPPQEFCLQCHTALGEALAKGQAHAPVKGGQCMACHEKHAGTQPMLLLSDKASLCGKCHDLGTPAMGTAHHGFDLSKADCQSCHEPHVGRKGSRALLLPESHKPFAQGQCSECHEGTSTDVSAGLGLCSRCHPDATTLVSKRVVHPALQQPDSCGSCHSPHVGFGAGLQKHEGARQCLTCHNTRPFTGPVKHAPAYEDCGTCHDPHSSDNRKLLSTSDVMELCLTCHENVRKTHFHPMGPGVTDPRTRKDLVCTGCHSPHSSAEPQLLLGDKNRQLCNGCHGTSDE
jgi:predicted CXXCH cytochrome family protein